MKDKMTQKTNGQASDSKEMELCFGNGQRSGRVGRGFTNTQDHPCQFSGVGPNFRKKGVEGSEKTPPYGLVN